MRLAADANVILSAALGHAAIRAIDEGGVELITTLETLKEVREHLPRLGGKYGLDSALLEARLLALGITALGPRKYRLKLAESRRRIEARDRDDVHLLALALALDLPIWTRDKDFEKCGVRTYSTRQLFERLGIRSG